MILIPGGSQVVLMKFYNSLKESKFVSNDTDQIIFIDNFSGRFAGETINWTGTVYALNHFIKKIDNIFIKPLYAGKWEVTSELFLVNGVKVYPHSLLKSSIGSNDRTALLDLIIENNLTYDAEE